MESVYTTYLFIMLAPTGVEPVKPTFFISLCSVIACPTTPPVKNNNNNNDGLTLSIVCQTKLTKPYFTQKRLILRLVPWNDVTDTKNKYFVCFQWPRISDITKVPLH